MAEMDLVELVAIAQSGGSNNPLPEHILQSATIVDLQTPDVVTNGVLGISFDPETAQFISVFGDDLVGEAKLVVEFAGDLGFLFQDLVLLDKLLGLFELRERLGRLAGGKQAAAIFKGFLLGRGAPGEGGHQANGGQKPAGPVGVILRGPHGCWW